MFLNDKESSNVARGSSILLPSMILGGALAIVISITVAQKVSVEDFGIYSIILSVQAVAGLFAGFSMTMALAKFISEYRVRDMTNALRFARTGLLIALLFSAVTIAIYLAASGIIGEGLYDSEEITALIPYSTLVVLSNAVSGAIFGVLQGCQRIGLMALMRVLAPLFSLVAVIALISQLKIEGVLIGLFLGQIIAATVLAIWLNRTGFPFISRGVKILDKPPLSALMMYAAPATLSGVMYSPVIWFGNTELALESGLEAVGYFAVAFVFYQALIVVPQSITIPLIPKVSETSVISPSRVGETVVDAMRIASVLLFPAALLVALFAEPIISVFYGSAYTAADQSVYLMATASYLFGLTAIVGALLAGLGRMWLGLATNLIWAGAFVVLAFITVPRWDADGLGATFTLAYAVQLVILLSVSERTLGVSLKRGYATIILSSLLFVAGYLLTINPLDLGWIAGLGLSVVGIAVVFWMNRQVLIEVLREPGTLIRR